MITLRSPLRELLPTALLGAALLLTLVSRPAPAGAILVGPQDGWCAAIDQLRPGEELQLSPGDYTGPCTIRRGGAPGQPIVIRAADPERRPRIHYNAQMANVLNILASHIVIRGLEFGPTKPDVDAVRILAGVGITVEDCHFVGVGGISVVANHHAVRGLIVRRNVIVDSQSTAMYFGCQDGIGCSVTDLVAEANYIRRVRAPDPHIGYGVEVKLNSAGIIRNNVIVDTKGPGIMVYGSQELSRASLVERNAVTGSRTSSGIVIGGGPVVVRNNVSTQNAEAGIGLEDYQRRGILRGVVIAHNTVYGNTLAGISVPKTGLSDAIVANNAVHARAGTAPLPTARPGLRLFGNVDCSLAVCFTRSDAGNFSPFLGSLLRGSALAATDAWMPRDDFFGVRRGVPASVGAIEGSAGAIPLLTEGVPAAGQPAGAIDANLGSR